MPMRTRDEHDIDDDLRREDIDAKRDAARRRAAERGNDPWAGPFGDYAKRDEEDDEDEEKRQCH